MLCVYAYVCILQLMSMHTLLILYAYMCVLSVVCVCNVYVYIQPLMYLTCISFMCIQFSNIRVYCASCYINVCAYVCLYIYTLMHCTCICSYTHIYTLHTRL